MIKTTISKALEMTDPLDDKEQYIYYYSEGKTIFYIGQSYQPFERLQQHLGQGSNRRDSRFPDAVGRFILDNQPTSLSWTMQVMSLSEIHDVQRSLEANSNMVGIDSKTSSVFEQEIQCKSLPIA